MCLVGEEVDRGLGSTKVYVRSSGSKHATKDKRNTELCNCSVGSRKAASKGVRMF